jgi:hypothetical protein
VIGYHGCGHDIGMAAVCGQTPLIAQNRSHHWLGEGIYFWENDPHRALEWAQEKAARRELENPFVIGAILDLGDCLDLQLRENYPLLRGAYDDLFTLTEKSGQKMPKNRKAKLDPREDKVLRFLDCAVINHLHAITKNRFDSVRGLFIEGETVFPGGEIFHKTHMEIAVRNPKCIVGLFLPGVTPPATT